MTDYLAPPLELDPGTVVQAFNEYMEAAFPGWTPAAGNLDARTGGAVSQIAAQLNEAASDGATNVFRYFGANIAGVAPHEATLASGTSTWVATDTLGHTIPAGTVAVWVDGVGNRWGFETLSEAIIAPGSKEIAGVSARAVIAGEGPNNLSGAAVELVSPLAFIASVSFPSPTNGGVEAESDAAYLSRLVEEIRTLSPKPIVPKDFNALLTAQATVGRATTIGGFNPTGTIKDKAKLTSASNELTGLKAATTEVLTVGTEVTGTGIPASTFIIEVKATSVLLSNKATETKENELTFTGTIKNGGVVTSWVGNAKGEALETTPMKELEALIQGECLAGVVYKVLAPKYTTINVAATVSAFAGQSTASVKEAVEAAIKSYLSPENWGQSPTGQSKEWNNDPKVRIVNVEHSILQVIGTHFVSALTLNTEALDITMAGVVALPKLGTLAVTVNIG